LAPRRHREGHRLRFVVGSVPRLYPGDFVELNVRAISAEGPSLQDIPAATIA
jgi:hypothetical protein